MRLPVFAGGLREAFIEGEAKISCKKDARDYHHDHG